MNKIRPVIGNNKGGNMADYVLNKRLQDLNLGNYLIKITHMGDKRWSKHCSFEYHVTVKYQITDLNNPKRKFGVIAPGFGPKPIELNQDRETSLLFFKWENFEDRLVEYLSLYMTWINREGYYPKDRDTGKVVA
tara:strand:- start:300 stop:701 length:402 start_codon:yes stop_codon:yes gene_type:complete